jgi:ribonuclease HII
MDLHEKDAWSKGFKAVAGIDEAGRGPLAGPVVASAVIFSSIPARDLGIRDSKTLTPSKREFLVFEIYKIASAVGVGIIWPDEIDSINIHRASLKAMEKAVAMLEIPPDFLLVDGSFPIGSGIPQRSIVSGDALSVSIAAASIIAKTTRDRIMDSYHRTFPQYNFLSNKGYGTKEHLEALKAFGPTPIHRRSFRGVVKE